MTERQVQSLLPSRAHHATTLMIYVRRKPNSHLIGVYEIVPFGVPNCLSAFQPADREVAIRAAFEESERIGAMLVVAHTCYDCQGGDNAYMVHDDVWEAAWPHGSTGFLCLDCLEIRLHRKLVVSDFTGAPINQLLRLGWRMRDEEGDPELSEENEVLRAVAVSVAADYAPGV